MSHILGSIYLLFKFKYRFCALSTELSLQPTSDKSGVAIWMTVVSKMNIKSPTKIIS